MNLTNNHRRCSADKMDLTIDHDPVDVHRLQVADMPVSTRRSLAKFLDCDFGSNWEILAEQLECHPLDIDWIRNRARNHPSRSPTLLFFEEFCTQRCIYLVQLVHAFDLMDQQACLSVLKELYGVVAISSILDTRALCRQKTSSFWVEVEKIGYAFQTHEAKNLIVPPSIERDGSAGFSHDLARRRESTEHNTCCVPTVNYGRNAPTKECTKICCEASTEEEFKFTPINATGKAESIYQSDSSSKPCQGLTVNIPGGASSRKHAVPQVRHLTHPLTREECEQIEKMRISGSPKLVHSSTLMDVPCSIHTVDKRGVRVFVTYTVDSKAHKCNVLRLCECLKRNQFSVSLDEREQHLLKGSNEVDKWHDQRYNLADYILILVSPLYRQITESNTDHEAARNAVRIHRRMISEYSKNNRRSRFIAVMMSGSTSAHVPQWLRENNAVYQWPSEYLNLFYRMMSPESVVSNFVLKQDQELAKTSGAVAAPVSNGLPR